MGEKVNCVIFGRLHSYKLIFDFVRVKTFIFSPLNLKFVLQGEKGFGSSSLVQHLTPDFLELSTYISLPNPATTTWKNM